MVPITCRTSSFLDLFLFLKTPISIQSIAFFCSSFLLCLQGQPEPPCSPVWTQWPPQTVWWLRYFVSFLLCLHGQPELFSSDLLSFHFQHLASIFSEWKFLVVFCFYDLFFSSRLFLVLFLGLYFFAYYPQPFFPLFLSL